MELNKSKSKKILMIELILSLAYPWVLFQNHFYECEDSNIAIYADDTTSYSSATDMPSVVVELQASAFKLFHWLKNSQLKANLGKSRNLRLFQLIKFLLLQFSITNN